MPNRIDHIVFGVRDLKAAARTIWNDFGLQAQSGGEHPGAGTANMIVAVGSGQFIELLTVTDASSKHPIVPWLLDKLSNGDRLLHVAIQPDDLDAEASRLGEPVMTNQRLAFDGKRVGFRLTGIRGAFGPDLLPFFVETTEGGEFRDGWDRPKHRVHAGGVRWVEFGSDPSKVRAQVGEEKLPFRFVPGRAGVTAVGLDLDGAEVALRA